MMSPKRKAPGLLDSYMPPNLGAICYESYDREPSVGAELFGCECDLTLRLVERNEAVRRQLFKVGVIEQPRPNLIPLLILHELLENGHGQLLFGDGAVVIREDVE